MTTGWFGVPGAGEGSKVHVLNGEVCLCGWRPDAGMQFQFCASGIRFPYIECAGCKAKAAPLVRYS